MSDTVQMNSLDEMLESIRRDLEVLEAESRRSLEAIQVGAKRAAVFAKFATDCMQFLQMHEAMPHTIH